MNKSSPSRSLSKNFESFDGLILNWLCSVREYHTVADDPIPFSSFGERGAGETFCTQKVSPALFIYYFSGSRYFQQPAI